MAFNQSNMKMRLQGVIVSLFVLKRTKKKAYTFALKESQKDWHEVTMYCLDENGEIMNHWYFKNGELKIKMF